MSITETMQAFVNAYYSPARFDEQTWQVARQSLLAQAKTEKQRQLVLELDQDLSDFEITNEERSRLKDKYPLASTLRPKRWDLLLSANKGHWADWAIDYFNQKARTTNRLDQEDICLAKTLFGLSLKTLGETALPLLSLSVFSSDQDLTQMAWNQIALMGSAAHMIGRDLVVARLLAAPEVATPGASVFGVAAAEEIGVIAEFLLNANQFPLSGGGALSDQVETSDLFWQKHRDEAKDAGLSRLIALGKQNAETAGLVLQAFTQFCIANSDLLSGDQKSRVLRAARDLAGVFLECQTACLGLMRLELQQGEPAGRLCALECLAQSRSWDEQNILADIKNCSQSADKDLCMAAYQILGNWALADASFCAHILPDLMAGLDHGEVEVQCQVAGLLGALKEQARPAVPIMVQRLSNGKEHTKVRKALRQALAQIDARSLQYPKILAEDQRRAQLQQHKHKIDRKIAEDAGVLGALREGSDLDVVLGTAGLADAMTGGIGGLIGARGTQFGSGGLGSRGSGLGGGGTAEGLGGWGIGGHKPAAGAYGTGGGSFGAKGEGAYGIVQGPPPTVVGNLDQSLIDAVVRHNLNQIRYCYQRELTKNPTLAGQIVVKFVIAADGTVFSACTKSSTMNCPAVENAINQRFMRFQFPRPKDGKTVTVTYPFAFSPG